MVIFLQVWGSIWGEEVFSGGCKCLIKFGEIIISAAAYYYIYYSNSFFYLYIFFVSEHYLETC